MNWKSSSWCWGSWTQIIVFLTFLLAIFDPPRIFGCPFPSSYPPYEAPSRTHACRPNWCLNVTNGIHTSRKVPTKPRMAYIRHEWHIPGVIVVPWGGFFRVEDRKVLWKFSAPSSTSCPLRPVLTAELNSPEMRLGPFFAFRSGLAVGMVTFVFFFKDNFDFFLGGGDSAKKITNGIQTSRMTQWDRLVLLYTSLPGSDSGSAPS